MISRDILDAVYANEFGMDDREMWEEIMKLNETIFSKPFFLVVVVSSRTHLTSIYDY